MPYPDGSLQRWAQDFVLGVELTEKTAPGPAPRAVAPALEPLRLSAPGRPPELAARARARKTPGIEALRQPARRAELVHTFWHHELQAAELMCWAILAFPETPPAFRRGLARIATDEVRHMRLYADYLGALGYPIGSFGVHDWFWERVPAVQSAAAFVATLGIGFEGANLDHTARFSERFAAAGDAAGAALIARVGLEERAHVRFARRWFVALTGNLEFERWRAELPRPLTPILFRGSPIARAARESAGLDASFIDALEAFRAEW